MISYDPWHGYRTCYIFYLNVGQGKLSPCQKCHLNSHFVFSLSPTILLKNEKRGIYVMRNTKEKPTNKLTKKQIFDFSKILLEKDLKKDDPNYDGSSLILNGGKEKDDI